MYVLLVHFSTALTLLSVFMLTMYSQVKIAAVKLVSGRHFTPISSGKIRFGRNDVHLKGIHL